MLRGAISQLVHWQERLKKDFYPSMEITFNEYTPGHSDAYVAIENYLSAKSAEQVTSLKAEAYSEKIVDELQGVKVTWYKGKHDEKGYYTLDFHPKDLDFIMGTYLGLVLQECKALKKKIN